ncbi:hypothetical protein AAVH_04091 [Aphelenchoides avenae]|nr:hypothetical protein AAVH_04091 [Aphelenchus avenae]
MASPHPKFKTRQKYTPEVEMDMWEFFLKELRRNNPQVTESRYTLWQEYAKLHAERTWENYDSHFRRKMLPRLDRYALDKEDKLLVLKKCRVTLDQRQVQKKDLERALNCQLQVDAKGNVLSCVTPEDHAEQDARDEDDGSDIDDGSDVDDGSDIDDGPGTDDGAAAPLEMQSAIAVPSQPSSSSSAAQFVLYCFAAGNAVIHRGPVAAIVQQFCRAGIAPII